MRNNCNKHRGKLNGRNGWCNHACATASLISSGCLSAFLLYQSIKYYYIGKASWDMKQFIFNYIFYDFHTCRASQCSSTKFCQF